MTQVVLAAILTLALCGAAVADAESDAVLALVAPADAEFTAVRDGNWSDPATWNNGIPTHGDVYLPEGMSVTLDCDTPVLRSLRVDGHFDATNARDTLLRVDTVVVTHMGSYVVCLDDTATRHRVEFNDDPTLSDARQLSLGFVGLGHVSLNGVRKTEAVRFVQESATALRMLDAPEHWAAGDTVVVAGAKYGQHEVRTVSAIDGYTLTLDSPLVHQHVAPDGMTVHVANFTRNIRFESAAPGAIATRGHGMFMHNPEQSISGVEFRNMGRTDKSKVLNSATLDSSGNLIPGTNQVGRYPCHLHRSGVQAGVATVSIKHCAIFNDPAFAFAPGWGFAHHSSKATIEHCASFNVFGSHFTSEAGNECGSWKHNIAIHAGGTNLRPDNNSRFPSQSDHAHSGHGFWLTGGGVDMENCVAANCKFSGVTMVSMPLKENGVFTQFDRHNLRDPSLATTPTIAVKDVPFRIVNQQSYACGHGLDAWQARLDRGRSLIDSLSAWGCTRDAMFISYCHHVDVPNLHLTQGGAPVPTVLDDNSGVTAAGATTNTGATDIIYTNPRISGFQNGICVPLSGGLKAEINGGRLDNRTNVLILEDIDPFSAGRICHIDGVEFAPGADFNVFFVEDWQPPPAKYIPVFCHTPDVVTLDGTQLYFTVQAFDFVPFPVGGPTTSVPAELIGKTNAQLAELGKAIYGKSVIGIPWPGTNALAEGTCEQTIQRLLERIRELEGN